MTTLTTAQEGRRTFILTMAASLALLSTVGLMYTLSDADRPAPVLADRTPPGVRDAVIIPVDQYDSLDSSPVISVATAEPTAPAVPAVTKAVVAVTTKASLDAPATVRPIKTTLALAADSQAEPAVAETDDTAPAGRPIKVALAMAPATADAEAVR